MRDWSREPRQAGILMHPTALPGPHGIGDLGPEAERFLDGCADAGLRLWQVLPLGPTGPGGSPYGSTSSFAGNPDLISIARLADEGLIDRDALGDPPGAAGAVDFDRVRTWKQARLREASARLRSAAAPRRAAEDLARFEASDEVRPWLDDWALYLAVKERHGGRAWTAWDGPLRRREPAALARARRELGDELAHHRAVQFLFFRQWDRVRARARERGIRVLGDLPIYVAGDSADVWSSPDLFRLDDRGRPTHVAGVPPDYFSATGQRWGNPLYRWDRLAETGHAWWIERVRAQLRLADLVRLDHFRGFAAFWEIPASERTAVAGRWVEGPGEALFRAIEADLGALPFVAEDLGVITEDVERLRDRLGLPGMKVLQFGIDRDSPHHPSRIVPRDVVYTGTHDNDTTLGWWRSLPVDRRDAVRATLRGPATRMPWDLVEAAARSPAHLAVVPVQDFLGLGRSARFNTPGRRRGNWAWRIPPDAPSAGPVARIASLLRETGRAG